MHTPNSRSSRRQSPSDGDDDDQNEEEEAPYEVPKPSKNFFSIFKRIQPIFSRHREMGGGGETAGGQDDGGLDDNQGESGLF